MLGKQIVRKLVSFKWIKKVVTSENNVTPNVGLYLVLAFTKTMDKRCFKIKELTLQTDWLAQIDCFLILNK